MTDWCHPSDVSVVIPCYRCGDTINRAVQSVLAQTSLPAEIIIVDDCSPDDSRARVEAQLTSWSTRVPVRILATDRNGGAAVARNMGIDAAQHDWIAFLDSDDFWLPWKLALQCDAMSNAKASISGHKVTRDPGSIDRRPSPEIRKITYSSQYFKNKVPTPTVLLRKNLLRFDPALRYAEDQDFWLRYIRDRNEEILFLAAPLTACVNPPFHSGGLSGNLGAMMKGQLRNLTRHTPPGISGRLLQVIAILWSLLRYVRRVLLSWMATISQSRI